MKKRILSLVVTSVLASAGAQAAIKTDLGTANIDLRLRLETVSQDNAKDDATGLTLRTKANFKTVSKGGFYAFAEVENNLALVEDYNNTLGDGTEYSVIADPAMTELDQAYLGYSQDKLSVKLGRQVITMDNHRFVGHVGWRQDKQTFDALSASYAASEKLKLSYAYISKRNRIFSDEKDLDSKDHLLNAQLKTSAGTLTGYGYLLEVDNDTDNAIDTYGVRFSGSKNKISYTGELATQTIEAGGMEYDTSYLLMEVGTQVGGYKVNLGYESLGSDDGAMAFATPLATLHKFNGWSDQFLGTPAVGLNDAYVSVAGKVGPGNLVAAFHSFSADESTDTVDDLGSEINLQYTTKIAGKYPLGLKYANYSAGDAAAGKVDTDKIWVWTGYTF